jgi:hypothetical protein
MGAFWDAWNKQGQVNDQAAAAQIQQIGGLAGLMKQVQEQQQMQKVQGLLSDPSIPMDQKRMSLVGLIRDPMQAAKIMHDIETERTARDKLLPKNMEFTSPVGKLLSDKKAAIARGDTEGAALIDAAIKKHNATENGTSQEDMNYILDVRKKGAAASPEEIDKAKFIFQRMTTPRVGADGSIIRPSFDDSFNPWKGFGNASAPASLIPPAPTPMQSAAPVPAPLPQPGGQVVGPDRLDPETLRTLQADMARNGDTSVRLNLQSSNNPNVRVQGTLGAPSAQPAPAARPDGSPPISVEGGKKYSEVKTDGNGGFIGLTKGTGVWEQIPMPEGARSDLKKGQRWNSEKGVAEWLPNTPEYAKQANAHGKDIGTLASSKQAVDIATSKVDELLDPKNKDAFESLFGGYTASVTSLMPGKTQSLKQTLESLKANLKTAGKEMLVNAGGTSIGQITEREWPILEKQIDSVSSMLEEEDARKKLANIKEQMLLMKKRIDTAYDAEWSESQFYRKGLKNSSPNDAPKQPAPQQALEFYKANRLKPGVKDAFIQKYGYDPEK